MRGMWTLREIALTHFHESLYDLKRRGSISPIIPSHAIQQICEVLWLVCEVLLYLQHMKNILKENPEGEDVTAIVGGLSKENLWGIPRETTV